MIEYHGFLDMHYPDTLHYLLRKHIELLHLEHSSEIRKLHSLSEIKV